MKEIRLSSWGEGRDGLALSSPLSLSCLSLDPGPVACDHLGFGEGVAERCRGLVGGLVAVVSSAARLRVLLGLVVSGVVVLVVGGWMRPWAFWA